VVAGLSLAAGPNIAARLPEAEHISAFMPCTPNPTLASSSMWRRDVIELDITVETAMTLLMSAGMAQSGDDDPQKNFAALADIVRARSSQTRRSVEPVK